MDTIKIGNFEVSEQDIDVLIARMPQEQQMFAKSPSFRKQVEKNVIDMVMFAAWAEDQGMAETMAYEQSMDMAKKDILSQMGVNKVFEGIEASDDEVKAFFENNRESFKSQAYAQASHILVDSEELANEIKEMLVKEEISFEDAAKKYSNCPSKEQGGDLGLFNPGQMVKEFDEAVFNGTVGEISDPVKSQFGYHLILVKELNDGELKSFDDVKDEIKTKLSNEKRKTAYDEKVAELEKIYIK